ncbi:unnamed protein product [Polarella glacialis]|uniref:3-dehydroquinate dehydratase n=1 Tax=Polarella glacialis TaxID=89957 RepID=A0A813DJL2_POLGL|nr:unnamed protein product [Polarella glacialis]
MAAAEFRAFQDYVKGRAKAQAEFDGKPQAGLGPFVLIGADRDSALLERLALVAKSIEGAGLSSISHGALSSVATTPTSAVLICANAAAESKEIVQVGGTAVVYVRSSGEREAWACDISSHEFEALAGTDEQIAADFSRLVRVLRCPPAPCLGPGSYFVSLTYPDVSQAMCKGAEWTPPPWVKSGKGDRPLHDGLEVRADLLQSQDPAFVLSQLALVRRQSEGLPIIFTVRSRIQGGNFPNEEAPFWQLTMIGLRFGVEYVDVEAGWSREGRHTFLAMAKRTHPGLRVIGSFHEIQRPLSAVTDQELCSLFTECAYGPQGSVDIVKVVGRAESAQCSIRVNQCAVQMRPHLPDSVNCVIAICTTEAGRLSRALNVMLGPTPVAHPSLPGVAAPGQLSALEIEGIRQTLGLPLNPFRGPDRDIDEAAKRQTSTDKDFKPPERTV